MIIVFYIVLHQKRIRIRGQKKKKAKYKNKLYLDQG